MSHQMQEVEQRWVHVTRKISKNLDFYVTVGYKQNLKVIDVLTKKLAYAIRDKSPNKVLVTNSQVWRPILRSVLVSLCLSHGTVARGSFHPRTQELKHDLCQNVIFTCQRCPLCDRPSVRSRPLSSAPRGPAECPGQAGSLRGREGEDFES